MARSVGITHITRVTPEGEIPMIWVNGICTVTNKLYGVVITPEQWDRWHNKRQLIQDVMPELSEDQREFLITKITPSEWKATLAQLEEEFEP